MDPDLRSQINIQLINGGHDKRIQDHLLYSLNAHPNSWPTLIQNRALALLRSGETTSFPVLLRQILEEVRKETQLQPRSGAADPSATNGSTSSNNSNNNNNANDSSGGGTSATSSTVQVNGSGKKANGAGPGPGEAGNLHQNTTTSLAVPQSVIDEALKVTRAALIEVAEFEGEENGST